MVDVFIAGDRVRFEVQGFDKVLAFKSHLEIPIRHIRAAWIDADAARGWWHGLRLPGTSVPGVVLAGTFYQSEGRVFCDVHDPERTVIVELEHEHYKYLVIEVASPAAVLAQLRSAIAERTT
jgi:hypothetical protein